MSTGPVAGDHAGDRSPDRPWRSARWHRGDEPEFTRIAAFTDAVFAIAMTLLVLDIRLPRLVGAAAGDPAAMWDAISDLIPQLVAFGVAFILLGRYWLAHHDFVARLEAFDRRLMGQTLVYLAFVALLPFPTSLVGEYEQNPLSVIVFAATLAVISGMETLMIRHAAQASLLRAGFPAGAVRWWVIGSTQPVVMFALTLPLAFVSTTLTLLSWAVVGPLLGRLLRFWRDPGLDPADLPGGRRRRAGR